MGDAGEGLIDADSRLQERMDELARAREEKGAAPVKDPELVRERESVRLARAEVQRQIEATSHPRRREQLAEALAELDRRAAALDRKT
jgi:hypothetical protein